MATSILSEVMQGNGTRAVHPFFDRANRTQNPAGPDTRCMPSTTIEVREWDAPPSTLPPDGVNAGDNKTTFAHPNDLELNPDPETPRHTQPRATGPSNARKQQSLYELLGTRAAATEAQAENGTETRNETTDDDLKAGRSTPSAEGFAPEDGCFDNAQRSKRRRTSLHESADVGNGLLNSPRKTVSTASSAGPFPDRALSPGLVTPASTTHPSPASVEVSHSVPVREPRTTPKKMLRLNASGKFSSPVSKKRGEDAELEPPQPKRRGRPRKEKAAVPRRQMVVLISYGRDAVKCSAIGHKISAILSGDLRVTPSHVAPKKKDKITPKKPTKSTHPFFVQDKTAPSKAPSPKKLATTTPGKLRSQAMHEELAPIDALYTSSLLKDRLLLRHVGMREPAWPSSDNAHVRGISDDAEVPRPERAEVTGSSGKRKEMEALLNVDPEESILRRHAKYFGPGSEFGLRADGFSNPSPSLRLPSPLLLSGEELAIRVEPQLVTSIAEMEDDELAQQCSSQISFHPALTKLYKDIPAYLSPFDQFQGESRSWINKYAPQTAATVLQPSREMAVLKAWLRSLVVTTVETQNLDNNITPKPGPKPSKKKRRRRPEDLDDFLVDDVEVAYDRDELTDPESVTSQSHSLKSVVQIAVDAKKVSNVVLLSGPYGCGKSAAAYAVAAELGFKVFEISPCERRSGRDVLDRVGDMTENHLVKHHGPDVELSALEESTRHEEALQRDLDTGRQGKMNAFFKPKPRTEQKAAAAQPKHEARAKAISAIHKVFKRPHKDQQQSLVLLEEVDILFREDKDFWTTVLKLIISSKRPFIMTCNDEDMVPIQAITFHAILRFSPPPAGLAVDYMLLIAALEGHLVKKDAIAALYQSKRQDLRASINELDFWCQMGVGDPKAGLSWLFQRWPVGSDRDEEGRTLRLVSEGSYETGMGIESNTTLDDADAFLWTWHEHGIDPAAVIDSLRASPSGTLCSDLKAASKFSEILSDMDMCSSLVDERGLDTTQKPLTEKSRAQYVDNMRLLQTDHQIDYLDLSDELAVWTGILAISTYAPQSRTHLRHHLDRLPLSRASDSEEQLRRRDFTCLEALSWPAESVLSSGPGLQITSLDGPLEPIAVDIAPWVRFIVRYDLALEEQREILNNSSGQNTKRARTTRAAMSALEGSQRASTRRQRWFTKELDLSGVLATGGTDWPTGVTTTSDAAESTVTL